MWISLIEKKVCVENKVNLDDREKKTKFPNRVQIEFVVFH